MQMLEILHFRTLFRHRNDPSKAFLAWRSIALAFLPDPRRGQAWGFSEMPYRSPPPVDPKVLEEAREVTAVADAARLRIRRAAVGVATAIAGALVAVSTIAGATPARPHHVCHNVEIRWENAPEVPPHTYTTCRSVLPR